MTTTAIEVRPAGEIVAGQPPQFSRDQVDLLKRTVCLGSTDDEFRLFLHVAERSGLDPFARQIHAVKRWSAEQKRETMAIQTGIDGYRLIADRTGKYAGNDDAEYGPPSTESGVEVPEWARVTVHKLVAGEARAFSATARWREYRQTKRDGGLTRMWAQMPYLMLAKCAEALALRKAFPAELSGLYTHEEMAQADNEPVAPVRARPVEAAADPVPQEANGNGHSRPQQATRPAPDQEPEPGPEPQGEPEPAPTEPTADAPEVCLQFHGERDAEWKKALAAAGFAWVEAKHSYRAPVTEQAVKFAKSCVAQCGAQVKWHRIPEPVQ